MKGLLKAMEKKQKGHNQVFQAWTPLSFVVTNFHGNDLRS